MQTLADSLRLMRPALPEVLVSEASFARLERLGSVLAPLHCAGFEVRLGDGPSAVDLVQRIRALDGEPHRLAAHVARSSALQQSPSWVRVAEFAMEWADPKSSLHAAIAGAFLGFDAGRVEGPAPDPSLYLSLEPGFARHREALNDLIDRAARLLRGAPFPAAIVAAVDRCHAALPAGSAITDVGFMLSRNVEAIRIVIAPLARDRIVPLVQRLEWLASPADVTGAVELIPPTITYLGVSLDVGAAVSPRLGLEYYPGPLDDDLPAWRRALDELAGAGLCGADKRDALLGWPGHLEPTESAAWLDGLLLESLLNRVDQFIVLARRLTFLKIVCEPRRPPRAKAYFGFGPRSFAAGGDGRGAAISRAASIPMAADERGAAICAAAGIVASGAGNGPDQACPRPREGPSAPDDRDRHESAIAGATGFLLDQRDRQGMWQEFPRILAGTDEWVTAYVGTVLAVAGGSSGRSAALDAWQALGGRRGRDEGWGYNDSLPADADSTAWGLRLAGALGLQEAPRARAAGAVLDRHVLASGGVATYAGEDENVLRAVLGGADVAGMLAAHTCVSAAAATTGGRRETIAPFLRARQEANGRWRGFWWSDDEYTTALAVDALVGAGEPAGAVSRARQWAQWRIDEGGAVWSRSLGGASAFATALCARILLGAETAGHSMAHNAAQTGFRDPGQAIERAVAWLLRAQLGDGSWPASALMRMPPPDVDDGDARPAATTVSVDDRRVFTTATVLTTLSLVFPDL